MTTSTDETLKTEESNPDMVFCRACGTKIHNSARACPSCGAEQKPNASGLTSSQANGIVILIVAIFFGMLGIHRFLVGKIGTGVIQLVLTLTMFGAFITGIWLLIDIIMIILGKFEDKRGSKITLLAD